MKVLIAVDGTKDSWDAVEFAQEILADEDEVVVIDIARRDHPTLASIGTLTGYGSSYPGYEYPDPDSAEPAVTSVEQARRVVESAADVLHADEAIVSVGDAAEQICRVAEEHGVDMIIMGTRDQNPAKRVFKGSVSHDVLDHAHCSVLIVR